MMFWRRKPKVVGVPSCTIGGIEETYAINGSGYVKFTAQFRDSTGASVDPTDPYWRLWYPNVAATPTPPAAAASLTKLTYTGFYYGQYAIPNYSTSYMGSWQLRIWGTVDGVEVSAASGFRGVRYDTDDLYTLLSSVNTILDSGGAAIDWSKVVNPGSAVDLSDTAINLCDTTTVNTDMRGTDSAATAAALQTVDDEIAALQSDVTALSAELDAIDAAIAAITGVDQYRAWGSAVYDPSTEVLSCDFWISKNGQRLTDPTAYSAVLYESGDTPTLKTTLVGDGTADARGVIHEDVESLTLTHRKLHYMAITVTHGGTPYPNNIAMGVI